MDEINKNKKEFSDRVDGREELFRAGLGFLFKLDKLSKNTLYRVGRQERCVVALSDFRYQNKDIKLDANAVYKIIRKLYTDLLISKKFHEVCKIRLALNCISADLFNDSSYWKTDVNSSDEQMYIIRVARRNGKAYEELALTASEIEAMRKADKLMPDAPEDL